MSANILPKTTLTHTGVAFALLALFSIALLPCPVANAADEGDFAATFEAQPESPRNWELELGGTFFTPRIDDESGLSGAPYEKIFGRQKLWLFEAELDFQIVDLLGTLNINLNTNYN